MSNLDEKDKLELQSRRLADEVVASVEKQLKSKYFWIFTIFSVMAFLGGFGILRQFVENEIKDKVTIKLVEIRYALSDIDQKENVIKSDILDAENQISKVNTLSNILENNQNNMQKTLRPLMASASFHAQVLHNIISDIRDFYSKVDPEFADKLSAYIKPFVLVRADVGIGNHAIDIIKQKIVDANFYAVVERETVQGANSVRYFHEKDKPYADELAKLISNSIESSNVMRQNIESVRLEAEPRPSLGTIELRLNKL